MLDAIKGFIGSKKAIAAVVGVLMGLFGEKMGLDPDAVTRVVGTIIAYILGQGVADLGKEKAKIEA